MPSGRQSVSPFSSSLASSTAKATSSPKLRDTAKGCAVFWSSGAAPGLKTCGRLCAVQSMSCVAEPLPLRKGPKSRAKMPW